MLKSIDYNFAAFVCLISDSHVPPRGSGNVSKSHIPSGSRSQYLSTDTHRPVGAQRRHQLKSVASDRKRSSSTQNGSSATELPSHVSHVLSHDTLLDTLTSVERLDPTFPRMEAQRLASRVTDALLQEAATASLIGGVGVSSLPPPTEVPSENRSLFGHQKNRFLWNPAEKSSEAYVRAHDWRVLNMFPGLLCLVWQTILAASLITEHVFIHLDCVI